MTVRVGINGFGRIGRAAYRIIRERAQAGNTDLEVVAINDLSDDATLAHLLSFDSVHGRLDARASAVEGGIDVGGKLIHTTAERDPTKLAWGKHEVDVVLESTGVFRSREKAALHLESGAKKVLISAPHKGQAPDSTICFGVNNDDFKAEHTVVSTASCTTNCLAPVAKTLHDAFGIEKAIMTTVHSYTNDQRILDLPHSDLRRARAAAVSMIPTSTGAAKALSLVLPELDGKFDGMAIRVPTPNVSLVDLVVEVQKDVSAEDVNVAFEKACASWAKGVMDVSHDPLVSNDYIGTNASSIIDALSTKVMGNRMVKILSWYDNEWGYTNRAVDLLRHLGQAC